MTFYTTLPTPKLKVDGILEGGGTLGTAYVGMLLALARNGVWFERIIGNSAGAIMASLVAAGYNANEIDWLCAPKGMRKLSNGKEDKPSTLPAEVEQIDFMNFLDAPRKAADLDPLIKRQTILWHAVKGTVLDNAMDEISKLKIRTPPLDTFVNKLVAKVLDFVPLPGSVETDIKKSFQKVLQGYPKEIGIDGKLLAMTEDLREGLADVAVDTVINRNFGSLPGPVWFNFLNHGGFCKGEVFLNTMRKLIGAKVRQLTGWTGTVEFRHLPIDLTMVAADTTDREMVIYSKTLTPGMEVALAVRQSMSLPIAFEPVTYKGHVFIDGGVFENYPTWLYGIRPEGLKEEYVTHTAEDLSRPKLAFLLDEKVKAPPEWKAPPPQSPHGYLFFEHVEALARGLKAALTRGEEEKIFNEVRTLGLYAAWARISAGSAKRARALHKAVIRSLYAAFYETVIPCFGYSFIDFTLNHEAGTFNSIAFRGWQSTVETLERNLAALLPAQTLVKTNPYATTSRAATRGASPKRGATKRQTPHDKTRAARPSAPAESGARGNGAKRRANASRTNESRTARTEKRATVRAKG